MGQPELQNRRSKDRAAGASRRGRANRISTQDEVLQPECSSPRPGSGRPQGL